MPVALLTLEIEIHHAQSLKDRRQVVRSIRDTLRRGFNVSVAEMDEALVWNRATLGIVGLSRSSTYLNGQMEQAASAARRVCTRFGAEITDDYLELLSTDDTAPLPAATQMTTVPAAQRATPLDSADNSAMVFLADDRNA